MKLDKLLSEKKNIEYQYSSLLCFLPQQLSHKILKWSRENIPDKSLYVKDNSMGRENDIHITVKYGFISNSPNRVINILKDYEPFDITLGSVTLFEKEDFDVVKIDVFSPILNQINKAVSKLPNTDTYLIYKPHVTIAYVKHGAYNHLNNLDFQGIKFKVNELEFSRCMNEGNDIIKL